MSNVDANSKVVFLLQRDASLVKATDYSNDAPIHCATLAGNSDVVKTLSDHGADVDARGKYGRTALHIACSQGYVDCICELLAAGAQVEARDSERKSTPLHLAADFNHPDYTDVELIYCRGCFNIRHNIDHTALTATVRVRRRHHQEVTTTTLDARVIVSLIDAAFQSG